MDCFRIWRKLELGLYFSGKAPEVQGSVQAVCQRRYVHYIASLEAPSMLLIIDNYDSFTYNLVQYFGEMGATMEIRRNDKVTLEEIEGLNPDHICISPGPARPRRPGSAMR